MFGIHNEKYLNGEYLRRAQHQEQYNQYNNALGQFGAPISVEEYQNHLEPEMKDVTPKLKEIAQKTKPL